MNLLRNTALALAFTAAALPAAHSAALVIDDTDVNTITITANDFEQGLYVNGNLLQMGLSNPASITLADGGYSISGSWIDLGATATGRIDISFAVAGNPTGVTSGIELATSSDGTYGTISGSFGGYLGTPYFSGSPTVLQDGHTENAGLPYFGLAFTSEPVPEPETYALMLAGLAGIGWAARRKAR